MTRAHDPAGAPSPRHRQGHPPVGTVDGRSDGPDHAGAPAETAAGLLRRGRRSPLRATRGAVTLGAAGVALLAGAGIAALPAPEPGAPTGLTITTTASPIDAAPAAAPTSAPGSPSPSRSPLRFTGSTPHPTAPAHSPVLGKVPIRSAAPTPPRPALPPPVDIRIAAQNLDLPVYPMGVDARGRLGIPEIPGTVSWYRNGPAPGSGAGSAVFAGHVDFPGGKTPLYLIKDLIPGDAVDVVLADGRTVAYRVRAVDAIPKVRLADTDLFRRDGAPVLRLVTCGGPWLPEKQDYRDNVVVTAELVR